MKLVEAHDILGVHSIREMSYSGTMFLVEKRDSPSLASGTDYFGSDTTFTEVRTEISGSVAWEPKGFYRELPGGMVQDGSVLVNLPLGYEDLIDQDKVEVEVDGKRLRVINVTSAPSSGELVLTCRRIE